MGFLSRLELSGPWQLLPVQDFSGAYPAEASWDVQELPAHWQEVDALATHTGKVVYRKAFPWPVDQTPEGKVILRLRGEAAEAQQREEKEPARHGHPRMIGAPWRVVNRHGEGAAKAARRAFRFGGADQALDVN